MPYLIGMILFALLIAPVTIKIDIAVQKSLTGRLGIGVWGKEAVFHFTLVRDEKDELALRFERNGRFKSHSSGAGAAVSGLGQIVRVLRRGDRARKLLFKSIEVLRVRAVARISLQDAAKTALLTEAAREAAAQLSVLLTRKHISHTFRTWPDFTFKGSACQGNCILFARLGNLALAAVLVGMLLKASAKQESDAKEAQKWNTPLET